MYELDKAAFGHFLAQLRREKGMTQKELAATLYVSDKAVSKWERGVSQSYRYHINPTRTFAQPIQPEGWITRKGGMRPVEGSRTAFSCGGFQRGQRPHLAHDFAKQSVVCYTLCRRCRENAVAAGEGKGI